MPASSDADAPDVDATTGTPAAVLFGHSDSMRDVRKRIDMAAPTDIPVLIVGESGTGKEIIARYIHSRSDRRNGPFIRINCPGIPGALLESEMFGYEKGAFTGASDAKAGLVEAASGGSLFLDGMAELEFGLQSKFLQFLQDNRFSRIGGHEDLRADVRVICTANRHLEIEVELGRFRQDLLYRINVITIELPPLRERRGDIPVLINFFVGRFSREFGRTVRPLSTSVLDLFVHSDWAGNIRQLENVIKRYVIFGNEDALLGEVCGREGIVVTAPDVSRRSLRDITKTAVQEIERKTILETLVANRWNRRRTAQDLSISYRALLYKMKEGGIPQKRLALHKNTESDESND
jgi:two-component system response regulator AtoC